MAKKDGKGGLVMKIYLEKKCPDCNGSGYDFGDGGQCDNCGGLGEVD